MHRYKAVVINGLWSSHSTMWESNKLNAAQFIDFQTDLAFCYALWNPGPLFTKVEEQAAEAIRNDMYWALIEQKVVNTIFSGQTELLLPDRLLIL